MAVPSIWLDRCLPDEFVAELSGGGRLRWLVDFASMHRETLNTDLVLVGESKRGRRSKVHLYGGTAGLISVAWLGADRVQLGFRDTVTFAEVPFEPDWRKPRTLDGMAALGPDVVAGLEAKATLAALSHGKEGPVQVAVMRGGPGWTALDREVVPQYLSEADRRRLQDEFQRPIALTRQAVAASNPWARNWKPKGNELDCLAVDAAGDLLAVEVKTGDANDLEQAPLQVAFYVQMLERCLSESPVTLAALRRTAHQRASIGLCGEAPPIADHPRVRPVVAVSEPVSKRAANRWPAVLEASREAGGPLAPEVWLVGPGGAVSRTGGSVLPGPPD